MRETFIDIFGSLQYELQTFTEKRETCWAFSPYRGGPIEEDGSVVETPTPWDISAEPQEMFVNELKILEVPGTSRLKKCHRCHGAGSLFCHECRGMGWVRKHFRKFV